MTELNNAQVDCHLGEHGQIAMELQEALSADGSIWRVCIIKKGKSHNKTVYGDDAMKDMERIMQEAEANGAPIKCNSFSLGGIMNHLNEKARGFAKGFVENIVGWFKNAKVVGDQLIADLHLDEGANKVRSLLMTAKKKGIAMPFGLSIDGNGKMIPGFENGEPVRNVVAVEGLSSVDCVTYPSAGGKFLSLIESVCKEYDMFKLLLESIGAQFPELVEGVAIEEADIAVAQGIVSAAAEKDERYAFELTEENIEDAVKHIIEANATVREEAAVAEAKRLEDEATAKAEADAEAEAQRAAESQIDNKGDDSMSDILKESKEELDAIKAELQKEQCGLVLKRVLEASELPAEFKSRVRESYTGRIFEEADLQTEVDELVETVSGYTKKVAPVVDVIVEERDKVMGDLQASMDILMGVEDENGKLVEGTDRWQGSIRRAYVELTGDTEITGEVQRQSRGSQLHEAITSGDFPYLLANSATKKLIREYNIGDPVYRKIAKVTSIPDYKTQDRVAFGEYDDLATVAEAAAYQEFATPSEEKPTYAATKRGNVISISRKAILNDDLRKFAQTTKQIGRAALKTVNRFAYDLMLSYTSAINDTDIYDGFSLYNATHANIGTTALSYTTLNAALVAMWKHKDIDDTLEMGITPKYLVVPQDLRAAALQIVDTPLLPGSANNDTNPNYKAVEVLVSPYLRGDANNWYLVADPMRWDGIELGFVQGREMPALITAGQEAVGAMFTNDQIQYKVRHEYGGTVVDYRPFYAGIVA